MVQRIFKAHTKLTVWSFRLFAASAHIYLDTQNAPSRTDSLHSIEINTLLCDRCVRVRLSVEGMDLRLNSSENKGRSNHLQMLKQRQHLLKHFKTLSNDLARYRTILWHGRLAPTNLVHKAALFNCIGESLLKSFFTNFFIIIQILVANEQR